MSLSKFKFLQKITSIPLTISLILLLYQVFGEKRTDVRKLKGKVTARATPSTPKNEKVAVKAPALLKAK